MRLTIVEEYYTRNFGKEINKLLNEGWELHGPMQVVQHRAMGPCFTQAMINKNLDMDPPLE